ncbi:hypothetical protein [Nitrosomonas sp. Is37]|uniref:hypothetical protein n=1 Tax=Nitrosomonas sp. Is37 TaxID=3080535 RepID=UPI00294B78B1|nr:hypothetical protein [Nitrosomonas sp. Is37]MDV6344786.1 hypothetical protein [Nitrosomonas sp. Is37]
MGDPTLVLPAAISIRTDQGGALDTQVATHDRLGHATVQSSDDGVQLLAGDRPPTRPRLLAADKPTTTRS